jgi:hypothetical protein
MDDVYVRRVRTYCPNPINIVQQMKAKYQTGKGIAWRDGRVVEWTALATAFGGVPPTAAKSNSA